MSQDDLQSHLEMNNGYCISCCCWNFGECKPRDRGVRCLNCDKPVAYGLLAALELGQIEIVAKEEKQ